ncbi:hypothetical protein M9H77_08116 [Catharanthus roseus]|uniref:Uncharacterized protein n=1 Tax=Catharanthus roseus TaxID=4058 RepID=A0ACC0BX07_CATRO|nr:hypothetical protein M9H77_08116 [Catharanthus roseus]
MNEFKIQKWNRVPSLVRENGDDLTGGQKARKEGSRSILDVPVFVLGDIFTRLPIAAILNSKKVCKAWYFLLSDPEFSKAYHKKPPFTSIVVSLGNSAFCLLELNADNRYTIKRNSPQIFRNPPGFSERSVRLLGSCNGLLLFLDYYSAEKRDNLYISNPLLGEYSLLPQPIEVRRVDDEAYGFGFSPKIGLYKVLRIIRKKWHPGKTEAHVCTIGVDEKWRIVGDNDPFPQANKYMEGCAFETSRFLRLMVLFIGLLKI